MVFRIDQYMRFFNQWFMLAVVFNITSCNNHKDINPVYEEEIQAYLDSMQLTATQDENGIWYAQEVANPSGKSLADGAVFHFYYTLYVPGGDTIAKVNGSEEVVGKLGVNAIYPIGLDLSLQKMRTGEKWFFIIPPTLAYGSYSTEELPKNAIVQFNLEVMDVESESAILTQELGEISNYVNTSGMEDTVANPLNQPETLPSGVVYKRKVAGQSGTRPNAGNKIGITYSGTFLNGTSFANSTEEVAILLGDNQVIPGLEEGIMKMELDEQAIIIIPSYAAYKESALVVPNEFIDDLIEIDVVPTYAGKVNPYQIVRFEVTFSSIIE